MHKSQWPYQLTEKIKESLLGTRSSSFGVVEPCIVSARAAN